MKYVRKKFFCHVLAIFQVLSFLFIFSPGSSAQRRSKLPASPETVYSNPASITINTSTGVFPPIPAATYPSQITASGMTGTITRVAVTLTGVTHPNIRDLDFLLVSPSGAKFIFASDLATVVVEDKVYTFADDAAIAFPTVGDAPSGTFKPTSGDGAADNFPAPAPAGPYVQPPGGTFASAFNGTAANGTWSLYVVDDVAANAGSLNDGWALTLTTDASPVTFTNSNYLAINDEIAQATPYGSTINVSGVTGKVSNLKVTLTGFSHPTPQDVDILLVDPNGRGLVLMSDSGADTAASNANLTFDDAAAANVNAPVVTGTYRPTDNASTEILDTFPSPAPYRPYNRGGDQLSSIYGLSPNGDWRLFVIDDRPNNAGSISGGWSIDITTTPITPPVGASCAAPSFSPANFSVGVNPTNLAIADFNNDTKADLAVTNQVSNDVSILLGNGDGTFAAQSLVSAGSAPYAVVAGKFNADSNFDLAVANSTSNNVSILLGNGNGTFSAPVNFFVGPGPISITAGDFNNDTKTDLATANFGGFFSGSISVLLGNGTGGFTAGNTVRTRTQPSYVTVLSFNGDANQDLAVANFGADSVSTFIGNGAGGFQLNQNIATGAGPVWIEVADLGTDGFTDLAIPNYNSDSITQCFGTAGGGFINCQTNAAGGANPISITAADFVGGGTKNLAVALSGSNTIKVLTSNVTVGQNPNAVESFDFNGDTKPDLISVNSGSNDVSILINSCVVARGNLFDYSGDRRTEYTIFRPSRSTYFLSSVNGTLFTTAFFGRPDDTLVPADYDGDRITDYAFYRPASGLWFVIDRFSDPVYFVQFGVAGDIAVPADYDGDGKADVAVWRPTEGNWYIRRSTDNVTQVSTFGMNGDLPAAADYDGDGKADIAVFRPSTGVWFIFRSSDFQTVIAQFGLNGDKTVAADYDGDGKADIAVWRPSTGAWYALKSSDAGVLATNWGLPGDIPVPGDYEGDGKFDFAVWRPTDGFWYVLKSSDNSPIYYPWGMPGDIPIPSAYVR